MAILDPLFCDESHFDIESDQTEEFLDTENGFCLNFQNLLENDSNELLLLLSKEKKTEFENVSNNADRRSAVEWIIRVNLCYRFAALTAILAVDYFDRFLSMVEIEKDKQPWMVQLAAVACLSLAAKVEETHVPSLLHFQVEGAKYKFEAKVIQRMELLVLSTLEWKMNPVTPLSFIDHIVTRLGLKCHLIWEFLRQCESLLLSVLADSRVVGHLPSVLATATILLVIQQVEPCDHMDYQNQLLSVLDLTWEKVNDCYQLIMELSNTSYNHQDNKRKYEQISTELMSSAESSSVTSSTSSSEAEPQKKIRVSEQRLRLPSLARVFVDVLGSPR